MQPAKFSLSNISIKRRLPLLIGTLLFSIILASTSASYNGVKDSAFEAGAERLQNLTKQLASLFQQSNTLLLNKTFTAANDPAIRAFLKSPSQMTRSGASVILQQIGETQDPNSLQVELWDTNHTLVLTAPDGASPVPLDLDAEFKASGVDPFRTSGPMRLLKDTITGASVAAVKDDLGKPIGYLVRWRRISITPAPKQLTDLLGGEAVLYFGNIRGDLLTNLERIVSKPRADLGSTGEVMRYSRDGNGVMSLSRPISGTPWYIAVELSEQALLAPARRFLRRILLVDLILFTVGIAGAFALSRGITRPLHSLITAVSAISAGDYSKTVDVQHRDELGLLAAGFNAMTTKVRTSQSELEENVQALRESEHRLQTVIENLSEGLVVSDLNGQLLNWNRAALELHGFASLDECLLKLPEFANIFELSDLNGSVLDLEQWPLPRIIRGERLRNFEVRIRRLDSDWNRVFNYGGSIVREAGGRLAAVVTMSDITESKRAEERFRLVVEASPSAILMVNSKGLITLVNTQTETLFGYNRAELLEQPMEILVPERYRGGHPGHRSGFFQHPSTRAMGAGRDLYGSRKDGTEMPIEIGLNPIVTDEGAFVLASIIDITERQRADAEIHRLNDELELRVIERTTQLEAANKEMEAFSYSASHDLRAPLRHLAGYASLLQKNGASQLDENSRRYVNTIIEESSRMGDLIDHLLNFSRLGRAALQKRPVDLQHLINEVVANTAVPEGQHISWTISDLPTVSADPSLLRLVFENLLSNAVKFTRKSEEPQIEIGCSSARHQVVLFVKDNGEGFDMRYVDKLFGVFQRLHRADEFEGTGIGLANVRRIVSRHGGTTWAEGIVGKGATFFITLPR